MRVVAIVQARVTSSRLPGKVLADLHGAPMLDRVVDRLRAASKVDDVVVATTDLAEDEAIITEAARIDVAVSRGSATDVLDRVVQAARAYRADVVVRATADCPLLDPEVIDRVIGALGPETDYASNTIQRTFPNGLDVEAVHADTLVRIARMGTSQAARKHMTAFVREQPTLFRIQHVVAEQDDSDLRWIVDTGHDLALARTLYALFDLARTIMPYRELVAAVRARPALATINAHVIPKGCQDDRHG